MCVSGTESRSQWPWSSQWNKHITQANDVAHWWVFNTFGQQWTYFIQRNKQDEAMTTQSKPLTNNYCLFLFILWCNVESICRQLFYVTNCYMHVNIKAKTEGCSFISPITIWWHPNWTFKQERAVTCSSKSHRSFIENWRELRPRLFRWSWNSEAAACGFLRLSLGKEVSLVVVQYFPICGIWCNISTKLPYCTVTDDLTVSS